MSAPLRTAARALYNYRATVGPEQFNATLAQFGAGELQDLLSCWQLYARDSQLRPAGSKPIWLRMAGRGEGKTRSAAEETLDVCEDWGDQARIILCSKTLSDVRGVMIRGESGLEACAKRRGYEVSYVANHKTVYHPSGAQMFLTTAEKPNDVRGPQCNYFWGDEISSWRNAIETFDNLMFAWRLPAPGGKKGVLTTTPKPNPIMFRLAKDEAFSQHVTISRGRTQDNAANLASDTLSLLESVYLGTRIGRQEMDGELLATLGTTVTQDVIHQHRVWSAPDLARRVVALDPSIDDKDDSDAAGIVVVGSDAQQHPHGYLLADYSMEQATFSMWARRAVEAFVTHNCDCIVAEVNQGGSGVVEAIQVAAESISQELEREVVVPVRSIWARESKRARAEPVGALYERGRLHHVGYFTSAEKELTTWLPGMDSPNILDAIVHGFSHLLLGDGAKVGPIGAYYD